MQESISVMKYLIKTSIRFSRKAMEVFSDGIVIILAGLKLSSVIPA